MKKIILILLILNSQFSILNSLWAQEIGVKYDEHGRVVNSSHGVVDANDRLAVLITYTYDSTGVVETRTLQSYDKQGRPVRKEVYTVDEYLLYTEEAYDAPRLPTTKTASPRRRCTNTATASNPTARGNWSASS